MKPHGCPPSPAPALVLADDETSFATRRARRPGWGPDSGCPGHPVICIVLSFSRAAGILICREGGDQRQTGMGKRERDRHKGEENSKIATKGGRRERHR